MYVYIYIYIYIHTYTYLITSLSHYRAPALLNYLITSQQLAVRRTPKQTKQRKLRPPGVNGVPETYAALEALLVCIFFVYGAPIV